MTAQANRIGHGVDVMHETDADGLMREMARRNVLVEICLSSNNTILGVGGSHENACDQIQRSGLLHLRHPQRRVGLGTGMTYSYRRATIGSTLVARRAGR